MNSHSIDRQEWSGFVDAFSRRHDGWLISVAVEEGASPRRYVAHDVPLRGVVVEPQEQGGEMMIFTGGPGPHDTHFVTHPVALAVEEAADGAEAELTISDDTGSRTIIEFRSPMRTELVDGMA